MKNTLKLWFNVNIRLLIIDGFDYLALQKGVVFCVSIILSLIACAFMGVGGFIAFLSWAFLFLILDYLSSCIIFYLEITPLMYTDFIIITRRIFALGDGESKEKMAKTLESLEDVVTFGDFFEISILYISSLNKNQKKNQANQFKLYRDNLVSKIRGTSPDISEKDV